MSTPHISAEKGDFAKTVLMPGDPLRAKFIADTFLKDVRQVTGVRGMLGFTGTYEGRPISVMGSGMGMPSIGIYSYELFKFYDVDNIIRIGSAGSYTDKAKLFDTVLATGAVSESNYARVQSGYDKDITLPSQSLNDKLRVSAAKQGIRLIEGNMRNHTAYWRTSPLCHGRRVSPASLAPQAVKSIRPLMMCSSIHCTGLLTKRNRILWVTNI